MTPFVDAGFWRRLDDYIDRVVRRRAWPLRAVVRGVRRTRKVPSAVVELLRGQVVDEVEQAQPYGLRSGVPEGMESVAVGIGGSSAHWVLVGDLDRTHAPTNLKAGEVVLYSQHGQAIRLLEDGSIEVSAPGQVSIESDNGQRIFLNNAGDVDISAPVGGNVILNGPGPGVARQGDSVALSATVTIGGTPYPVVGTGTISSGSATVQAGG